MSRLIITQGAATGLERCRRFLAEKDPRAARRAGQAIEQQLALLETNPGIGRPFDDTSELRELVITFGGSGYIAIYQHEPETDTVYILAFRHQKELGLYRPN